MKRKMKHSVMAAFIIIFSGLFLFLSFSRYQDKINEFFKADMQERLASDVSQSANITGNKMRRMISSLQLLSQGAANQEIALTDSRIFSFLDKGKETGEFSAMATVLPDGTVTANNAASIRISDSSYLQKMMAGGSVVFGSSLEAADGGKGIVIGVPVSRNSKVIGGILGYLFGGVFDRTLETNTFDKKGTAFLINQDGNILFSSATQNFEESNFFTNSNLFTIEQESILQMKNDIQKGKMGGFYYHSREFNDYVRYAPVNINGWYFVYKLPFSVFAAKSKLILQNTTMLSIELLAVLLILGGYWIIKEYRYRKALEQIYQQAHSTLTEIELFLSSLPGGVLRYTADKKGEFKFVSQGILKIFGYTKRQFEEAFYNQFENTIYPNDRKRTLKSIHHQIEKNNFAEVEYRMVTSSGEIRWMLNRVKVVTDMNGEKEFCAVVVDVTNSEIAHKKARDAMLQLETLSNSIPGGVAQFLYHNGSLILIYANDGFYRLSGYGKNEYQQLPEGQGIWHAHPNDFRNLQVMLEKQIKRQEPLSAEYRLERKNSEIIWVSLSGTRTVNSLGQVVYQCIFTDITSFKKTQQELELEKERYEIAENLSDDILFEYNIETDYMEFSPLFTALTGRYSRISKFTSAISEEEIIHTADLPAMRMFLEKATLGDAEEGVEFRFKTSQGEFIWHRVKTKIIFDENGKPSRMIGKAYNIDKQKKEMQRLTDKSQRDPLTNLYNKIATQSRIEDDLKNAEPGRRHALMIIDIDNFKSINDNYGHLEGDVVITEISSNLQMLFRTSDVVGRVGGDEFIVFLRDIPADYTISLKAKAIRDIFRNSREGKRLNCKISGSIGIALYPTDGTTYQELFSKADTALYRAKEFGKDCFTFYNVKLSSE